MNVYCFMTLFKDFTTMCTIAIMTVLTGAFIISISQMKKLRLSGACSLLKIIVSKTPSLELGSYVSAPRACILKCCIL